MSDDMLAKLCIFAGFTKPHLNNNRLVHLLPRQPTSPGARARQKHELLIAGGRLQLWFLGQYAPPPEKTTENPERAGASERRSVRAA